MFMDSETIEDAFDREKAKITNRRSVNVPQLILCALEIKISIELFDLIREKSDRIIDARTFQIIEIAKSAERFMSSTLFIRVIEALIDLKIEAFFEFRFFKEESQGNHPTITPYNTIIIT